MDRSNCQSNEIGGTFSADRRQIFNSTVVYRTPKLSNPYASAALSDWVVTGIYHATSAYWLTVSLSTDVALTGATGRAASAGVGKPAVRQPRPGAELLD